MMIGWRLGFIRSSCWVLLRQTPTFLDKMSDRRVLFFGMICHAVPSVFACLFLCFSIVWEPSRFFWAPFHRSGLFVLSGRMRQTLSVASFQRWGAKYRFWRSRRPPAEMVRSTQKKSGRNTHATRKLTHCALNGLSSAKASIIFDQEMTTGQVFTSGAERLTVFLQITCQSEKKTMFICCKMHKNHTDLVNIAYLHC